MAGDMSLYAQRDNELLIRIENGNRIARRINLNSPDFWNHLLLSETNDVVYVELNKDCN